MGKDQSKKVLFRNQLWLVKGANRGSQDYDASLYRRRPYYLKLILNLRLVRMIFSFVFLLVQFGRLLYFLAQVPFFIGRMVHETSGKLVNLFKDRLSPGQSLIVI